MINASTRVGEKAYSQGLSFLKICVSVNFWVKIWRKGLKICKFKEKFGIKCKKFSKILQKFIWKFVSKKFKKFVRKFLKKLLNFWFKISKFSKFLQRLKIPNLMTTFLKFFTFSAYKFSHPFRSKLARKGICRSFQRKTSAQKRSQTSICPLL